MLSFNLMGIPTMDLRNRKFLPIMDREGRMVKPYPQPPPVPRGQPWYTNLKPYERLFYHQTLSSVRTGKRFKQCNSVPKDSLDLHLQAYYDHGCIAFPKREDHIMQVETATELITYRLLRNVITVHKKPPNPLGHPIQIINPEGPRQRKIHPEYVKLMVSGPHSQLTNGGFSRQDGDGNFFNY
ncbi:uncharacterized protein LOC119689727 [Teleopsis dalmanni]|uniref:uncharacterized protein LOC119689727 n=1 Tax=Teleopsis dalmanni TaxID=139649 RepID=UPI0018CFD9B4|nr:uncharacterized protein LOC119689727 [Teleopsis dalmanni]